MSSFYLSHLRKPTVTASAADVEAKSAVTDFKNDKISALDEISATTTLSTARKSVSKESTEFLTGRRIRFVFAETFVQILNFSFIFFGNVN